ncbi:MAG: type II secretion system F family protein [Planctomycetota bacterium]|nr:type II secretion system F family protein [Planctomycetota bacterium]
MPVFAYTALDASGEKTSGTVPAQSRSAALEQVTQKGLVPVSMTEQQPAAVKRVISRRSSGRVSQANAEAFTRELANLLAAGVPMNRALNILCREATQPAAKKQWTAIHDDIAGGESLADAMNKWPRSFPAVQVAMVRAGETGGFLDVVLGQIADFRSRERDLKSKVKGALIYPAILTVLATGVLIFLMTYFIPRFTGIFADFGEALPALTRGIVAISLAITEHGLLILVGAALVVMLTRRVLMSESGRLATERLLLRIPALGRVLARFALVRFCRMLGTLLGAGVSLVASLRVAREAIGNQTLSDAMGLSIEQVQQGKPLSRSLASCEQLFPASVVEVIAVAEESGRLDIELKRLALVHEEELDRRLRMLVALAEPVLLFIMAGIVGTIVIGMLLPVFTLQEFIR